MEDIEIFKGRRTPDLGDGGFAKNTVPREVENFSRKSAVPAPSNRKRGNLALDKRACRRSVARTFQAQGDDLLLAPLEETPKNPRPAADRVDGKRLVRENPHPITLAIPS